MGNSHFFLRDRIAPGFDHVRRRDKKTYRAERMPRTPVSEDSYGCPAMRVLQHRTGPIKGTTARGARAGGGVPAGFEGGALDFASSLFCWGIFHLTYSLKIIGPAILVALALGMAIYNRIRMTRNDAKNALNSNKE